MIVSFSGPRGGFWTGAEQVLLFRDNVQHHLQSGFPLPGYAIIHAMADVVSAPESQGFAAADLWGEVSLAFRRIRHLESRDFAMSIRTRAILTNAPDLPDVRGTALVRLTGWHVPMATANAPTLGDIFQGLVTRLDIFTASGRVPWNVQIRAKAGRSARAYPALGDDTLK
jgi:hypothetical protein